MFLDYKDFENDCELKLEKLKKSGFVKKSAVIQKDGEGDFFIKDSDWIGLNVLQTNENGEVVYLGIR
ncbi:MAG: hypothetical protein AB8B73_11915 [Ekhidna sp.]